MQQQPIILSLAVVIVIVVAILPSITQFFLCFVLTARTFFLVTRFEELVNCATKSTGGDRR
jgi:hypothetical protein